MGRRRLLWLVRRVTCDSFRTISVRLKLHLLSDQAFRFVSIYVNSILLKIIETKLRYFIWRLELSFCRAFILFLFLYIYIYTRQNYLCCACMCSLFFLYTYIFVLVKEYSKKVGKKKRIGSFIFTDFEGIWKFPATKCSSFFFFFLGSRERLNQFFRYSINLLRFKPG